MKRKSYSQKIRVGKGIIWENKTPLLRKLDLELTERCNNNCIHCYIRLPVNDPEALKKELSTEEIKKILKEAADLGCLRVRFTGGEPLLKEDFEEVYVFARKLGLKILIFTNATLISPRIANLFSRIPPLEKVEVTMYGMKKESYETVSRTPGSHEAAWRGVSLLQEKRIPFIVKGTVLSQNRDEMDEFEAWAAKISWMDSPPAYSLILALSCRRDTKTNILIKSMLIIPEENLRFLVEKSSNYLKEMKTFCSKFMAPPGKKLFACGAGIGSGCVDAYGLFQMCMMLRHPQTTYDLKRGSVKEALTNFFPEIRRQEASNIRYLKHCSACFLKGLCLQCPSWSWMEHGTLDSKVEYLCEIAHAQARYLGLLRANEKAWEVSDWKERVRIFSTDGESQTKENKTYIQECNVQVDDNA